jgi:hypothetical protein
VARKDKRSRRKEKGKARIIQEDIGVITTQELDGMLIFFYCFIMIFD